MRNLAIAFLIACGVTQAASAQADPDSVKHRADCRLAEQVVSTGHPRPHSAWAGSELRTCGKEAFERAALAALRRLATSTDTAELAALWGHALLHVNDRAVFDEALRIAGDPAATPQARGFAFVGGLRMLKPNAWIVYSTVTATAREGEYRSSWCTDGWGPSVHPSVIGEGLDARAGDRMRQVGLVVENDVSAPVAVRAAALCAARL
jgi:hypothetical protein